MNFEFLILNERNRNFIKQKTIGVNPCSSVVILKCPLGFMARFIFGLLLLSSMVYSQPHTTYEEKHLKTSIRNLTRPHVVSTSIDLTYNEKKIIGFVNGSIQLEYKLTGETVAVSKEFGNMGLIITNKNLLALSNSATEFSRKPLYGDTGMSYTISNSLIFVVTNKKIYYYTISSTDWKTIDLTGEIVLTHAAFDKTGALITNKRLISYSEHLQEFHYYPIDHFTPIYSFTVLDNKIVYDSLQKTIIYRPETGEYSVVKFN